MKAPWGPSTIEPLKGPILKEAFEDVGMTPKERKTRTVLTRSQRVALYEAWEAGATRIALSDRFDVSPATVTKIYQEIQSEMSKANTQIMTEEPEKRSESLTLDTESSFVIEGDFIVIKVPLKAAMAQLLMHLKS